MSVTASASSTGILSPIPKCSHPRPGLEKGFSMYYSPVQKLRTWNEGCTNLWTDSVTRSIAMVDAEVMSWYIAGTELISGNSQRRSKGADFTQTLFQNINLNQIFSQLFSTFTSFHSLCLYSKCSLKHKAKSSESQWTRMPGAVPFQLPDKIFWKASAEWSSANPLQMLLDSKPAEVGWRSLVNATGTCSSGGTKLPGCGPPPQHRSGLIKSFQAR